MTKKETKTLAGVIGNPPRPSQALKDLREIISELPRLGGDAVKYFPKLFKGYSHLVFDGF